MDVTDLEAWMLKANALAHAVAAKDANHETARSTANWLLQSYESVAGVRERLRSALARIAEDSEYADSVAAGCLGDIARGALAPTEKP